MTLRQYDPALLVMTLGVIVISGFEEDTFVSIEPNEDAFKLKVGADGEATRSRVRNESGRVTFTLQHTSLTNVLLGALLSLDRAAPGGAGCVPLLIKDMSGSAIFAAEKAWIARVPTVEYGNDATPREWIIESDRLRHVNF